MFDFLRDFIDQYGDLLVQSSIDTLLAVSLATTLAYILGILLAVVLKITAPGSLKPQVLINSVIGWIVNMGRSIPFIILMVILIPLSRMIVGTSLGVLGSIIPLTIGAAPFVARIVESSFEEVPAGSIEAAQAFGASTFQIIWKVYLRESLPSLIRGAAITLITLIGYQAIMGAFGGGGLGDVAVRFGYHRYKGDVMVAAVLILIVLVQLIQSTADLIARKIDKR
ncbi:MAG: ABC transporter permease [Coriobacteriales bacterium]|jgi:D-methionine transport system permease protein|nr:ABC transporter permease [Coriobacteriales bacterium]